MTLHIEDIEIGSWVVVLRVSHRVLNVGAMQVPQPNAPYENWRYPDGRPYQLLVKDLPYVVLYCPVQRNCFPADQRGVEFKLASQCYVDFFKQLQLDEEGSVRSPQTRPPDIYADHVDHVCPRCGQRLELIDATLRCSHCDGAQCP